MQVGRSIIFSFLLFVSSTTFAQDLDALVQRLYDDYYQNLAYSKVLCTFKDFTGKQQECLLVYGAQESFYEGLQDCYQECLAAKARGTPGEEADDADAAAKRPVYLDRQEAANQKYYAFVDQRISELQDRFIKILDAKKTSQNAAAIDFLKKHLFKTEGLSSTIVQGPGEDFNAWSNYERHDIHVGWGFLTQVPPTTLTAVLAHELGHYLSLPYFLGYDHPLLWPAEDAEVFGEDTRSKARQANDRLAEEAVEQKNRMDDYPFIDDLRAYQQIGITGLALLDPAKKDKIYAWARRTSQRAFAEGKVLQRDFGREAVDPADLEQWLPMIILGYSLADYFEELDETDGVTEEDLTPRIDEILADHFSRLVLESYLQEMTDPLAKQKFAKEYLLLFIFYADPKASLALEHKYPQLLLPALRQWSQEMQKDPAKKEAWNTNFEDFYTYGDHPAATERLKIFLSSPIVREAVFGKDRAK